MGGIALIILYYILYCYLVILQKGKLLFEMLRVIVHC